MIYDVLVIGAGVTGSLTARELTKYNLSVCLVEKGHDAASGASRANSGIVHAGFDAKCGTLKALLNVRGCAMMKDTARDLDVEYKNTPSLVLCLSEDRRPALTELYERGVKNGVPDLRIIEKDELKALEPNVTDEAVCALYAPTAGIISPYELAIAAGENAVQNGADYHFEFEVGSIVEKDGIYTVTTTDGTQSVSARYVVAACGIFADDIAAMTGDEGVRILPRKGEYMLFDKAVAGSVRNVIFPLPDEKGKGIIVAPTADGNMLIGPNAVLTEKDDRSTTAEGLDEIHAAALRLMPSLPSLKNVITSFAGLRPTPASGDYIIKASEKMPHVLHLAGIESPGLASSPAVAAYAVEKLNEMGLVLTPNEAFNGCRRPLPRLREASDDVRAAYIAKDPAFARIVCRCETVTEGEIVDVIRRPMGATTIDGVKRRTRAGMGRCQGGFCMPKVAEILSRELGIPLEQVQKFGKGSEILVGSTK